jgi:membrane protein YdbS with pleckstrin-like domain
LFRQYETIAFSRIQTLDLERGPLLWLFGLTEMRLWTGSADQFNSGEHDIHAKPDTTLVLARDTAQELKDFISGAKKTGDSV